MRKRILLILISGLILFYLIIILLSSINDRIILYPVDNNTSQGENNIMQYCSFIPKDENEPLLGTVVNNNILSIQEIHIKKYGYKKNDFNEMTDFIKNIDENQTLVKELIEFYNKNKYPVKIYQEKDIIFLPPVIQPIKLVDCGLFPGHERNITRAFMKKIIPGFIYHMTVLPHNFLTNDELFSSEKKIRDDFEYFVGNNIGIYGNNNEIILPENNKEIDIEPELAIIIKKNGKNIPIEKALEYIGGYCLYNDFTFRDIQEKELIKKYGFVKSKIINSMGPYLVTGIEPMNVEIRVKINNKDILTCSNKDVNWNINEVISYISSKGEGIVEGEIIGMGAMSGSTLFELELPLLRSGDSVELIANQNLGILKNTIK